MEGLTEFLSRSITTALRGKYNAVIGGYGAETARMGRVLTMMSGNNPKRVKAMMQDFVRSVSGSNSVPKIVFPHGRAAGVIPDIVDYKQFKEVLNLMFNHKKSLQPVFEKYAWVSQAGQGVSASAQTLVENLAAVL